MGYSMGHTFEYLVCVLIIYCFLIKLYACHFMYFLDFAFQNSNLQKYLGCPPAAPVTYCFLIRSCVCHMSCILLCFVFQNLNLQKYLGCPPAAPVTYCFLIRSDNNGSRQAKFFPPTIAHSAK